MCYKFKYLIVIKTEANAISQLNLEKKSVYKTINDVIYQSKNDTINLFFLKLNKYVPYRKHDNDDVF